MSKQSSKLFENNSHNSFNVLAQLSDLDTDSDDDSTSINCDTNTSTNTNTNINTNINTNTGTGTSKKPKSVNKESKSSNRYIAPIPDEGFTSIMKKKYKSTGTKQIYSEMDLSEEKKEEMGNNIYFNSKWNLYFHNNNNPSWKTKDYELIDSYHSIGEFWRIFNNYHFLDKMNNQVYIMRDGIMPIWEDINNRGGGIYSLKIKFMDKNKRNSIGSELMTSICLMLSNECIVCNNKCINGINYAIKNTSILIKLWVKDYQDNINFIMAMPIDFLNVVDNVLQRIDVSSKSSRYNDVTKVSTRWTPITPED